MDGRILPPRILVDVAHPDYMEKDMFALRLTIPDVIMGCYEYGALEYETTYVDPEFLEIHVLGYTARLMETDTPQLECARGYQQLKALIPMSQEDLIERGTRKIKFKTRLQTDEYTIRHPENRIVLQPVSANIFVPRQGRAVEYDFRDMQSIILSVPSAGEDEDLTQRLEEFAKVNGAQVMGSAGRNAIKVYDPENVFFTQMDGTGMSRIGSVLVERVQRKHNGNEIMEIPLTVFAKPL